MKFRFLLISSLLLIITASHAQKKYAFVSGMVLDQNENALSGVSVTILGQSQGIKTSDSGTFHLKVPADKAIGLVFSYTGFKPSQQNFLLNEGE